MAEDREELVKDGREVVHWRGKGQDCYIRDPFGVIYNIWEKTNKGKILSYSL